MPPLNIVKIENLVSLEDGAKKITINYDKKIKLNVEYLIKSIKKNRKTHKNTEKHRKSQKYTEKRNR